MRVTLIHNSKAGDGGGPGAKKLRKLITDAGHEVTSQSARKKDWLAVLDESADLVAVAGGDGTVGRVAQAMRGRDVPLAILPLGTANNIARSLGLSTRDLEQQIAGWEEAPRVPFDLLVAQGPWGRRHVVEGLGIGLFAWTLPHADDSKALAEIEDADEAMSYALAMLKQRLDHFRAQPVRAELDGEDVSGEYLLFEALNQTYVGSNLCLAPAARPGDGLIHVVGITERERDVLTEYLLQCRNGGVVDAPRLPSWRGRRLAIEGGSYEVHLDDTVWPDPDGDRAEHPAAIDVSVEAGALVVLGPAGCQSAEAEGGA